ncbi:MAG: hypothetical protein U9N86_10915 [Bacteroidota bacterium]|nr:hypothetical protein [Bacteroidota bacterium]
MHATEKAEQMQGALISHMSGLVKQHGGINLARSASEIYDAIRGINEFIRS